LNRWRSRSAGRRACPAESSYRCDAPRALKLWKSIGGTVPYSTSADKVLSDDYLAYANNVRYYMVGDGSATLRDVEDSRTKAETTLAALR